MLLLFFGLFCCVGVLLGCGCVECVVVVCLLGPLFPFFGSFCLVGEGGAKSEPTINK